MTTCCELCEQRCPLDSLGCGTGRQTYSNQLLHDEEPAGVIGNADPHADAVQREMAKFDTAAAQSAFISEPHIADLPPELPPDAPKPPHAEHYAELFHPDIPLSPDVVDRSHETHPRPDFDGASEPLPPERPAEPWRESPHSRMSAEPHFEPMPGEPHHEPMPAEPHRRPMPLSHEPPRAPVPGGPHHPPRPGEPPHPPIPDGPRHPPEPHDPHHPPVPPAPHHHEPDGPLGPGRHRIRPEELLHLAENAGPLELLDLCHRELHRPELGVARGQELAIAILAQRGEMSQRELQDMLRIQPASMSELIFKLERKGYLTRERAEDRRANLLRITDAGMEVAAGKAAVPGQELLSTLTPEERDQLTTILRKLFADWVTRYAPAEPGTRPV